MSPSTRRALTRFERAVRAHAFKGAHMPEEHEAIEREYKMAKATVERLIGRGDAL